MIQRKFCLLAAVSLLALATARRHSDRARRPGPGFIPRVVDDRSGHAVRALFDLSHRHTGRFPSEYSPFAMQRTYRTPWEPALP